MGGAQPGIAWLCAYQVPTATPPSAQVDPEVLEAAHHMLAPLCLRRLKAEVELGMPPLVETRICEQLPCAGCCCACMRPCRSWLGDDAAQGAAAALFASVFRGETCPCSVSQAGSPTHPPNPFHRLPVSEMQTFWYRRLLMKDSAALLQVEKEVERKIKVSRGSDGRLSRTVEWSGGLHAAEHVVPGRGISLKLLRTVCLPPCCDSTTQPTTTGRSCRCWCSSCASAATTRCDRAS